MKKRIVFILFLLLGSFTIHAQSGVIAGEYFWGTIDPGVGTGTAFTATDGNFGEVIESIVASAQTVPNLSSPILLNVRVKDVNNKWGPRFKKVIFLTSTTPTPYNVAVTQGEFFFGSTDPGQGNGTPLVVFDGNWGEAVEAATSLNTTWNLSAGLHLFNIRAKDGNNVWGPLFKKTISVQGTPSNTRLCKIQSAEFFFGSTDPGQGNGTSLLVLDDNWSDAIETAFSNNTSWNLANGLTLFNVRVKDETNQWGPLFKKTLSVQGQPTFRNLTINAAEFFFGTFDPGAGAGITILAFDGDYNSAIEQAFVSGYAWNVTSNSVLFNIRFKDESNQWGPLFKKTIFKNDTPTGRALNITFAEYYFGVFDPGAGNGAVIVAFDGNFDNAVEALLRNHLTWENQSGSTLFNIRVKDEANKWGPVFKRTIFFNGSNPAVNLITEGETISRCPTFPVTLNYAGPLGFNVTWEDGTVGNTVTFVPNGSGYFTMTAQLGNEYLFDSIYVNVYELPPAVVDPTGEILVCQSSTVYLNVNTANNYSYQWYFNDALIPGSTQPTILPTEVGAYKVLVTNNTTTCQQMSLPTTFYLTAPIFPSGTVSTACNPNGVTLTAPVSPSNTYQWKKNGANISGATNSTYVATTPGNYQVTVTSGACVSTSPVTNVTSTGTTVVAQIAPTGTQSICDGQTLTLNATTGSGYTYQWKKDGVAIVGAIASSYVVSIPGVYTCTVTSTGCSLTSNATTVNTGAPVTPSVAISADATTVCSSTAVNFTATPTNGGTAPTYQWKKNGVNITGATSATYSLTAPANNDVITLVMTSNNACQSTNTSTSNPVTLVVNNAVTPTVSITAATNNVCSGTSIQFTSSITNGGTTPAYQWKKNGVNISGATTASYTSSALSNGDVITLSLTSNAACASTTTATSNAVTMVINAAVTPSVSIAANNTTVCSGTAVNFTATPTNGGTTPTYQWKKNGVNITGATSATYSLTAPANNDVITVVMTSNNACQSTNTSTSNAVTITVTTSLTPSVSIAADATTVCSGTAVNFTATPTNGGTAPTYQWKKNGVNITGATSATYSLTAPANNDVITVVMTSNSGCVSTPTATSNAVTLVVNNAVTPTVSITAGTNNVCSGTSVQFTSSITNGGTTPAYQWKKNGVNITGATTASYTSNALSNGDVITLSLTSNAACASTTTATSNAVTMVINAAVTPSVSITANNTTVCSGTAVNFTATPTNGGTTPTYQWKKNGMNITGATSATYSLTAPANNDVITVVMTSNNACQSTNTSTSNAVTITVTTSLTPSVSIAADATTVCSGTAVNFTATPTNGGTTPTYQWKKNGVNITGATSATYSLTSPANNDVITVVMTSNSGCLSTPTATSNAVTLVVNNAVTPSVSITAGANNVCSGTSVQFTSSITNGGTTPAYQWKKNGVNITGATLSSYTTDVLVNGDVITLSLTSNAVCASTTTATSNAVTMVIIAAVTPSVSIAANNTTVCSGTAVNFTATPTNGGTTPTYQWKKNGVNITGATSATYSLTAPANNDVITVVMTSNNACQSTNTSTSNAVTITVTTSLTPSVSIAADATTVCSGTAVNFMATPTNGGTAPTYQWKKNGVNITGATSATYSLTSPANNDVITVVMTSNSGCLSTPTATSNAVTLVVNNAVTPTVSITAGANNVCSGTSVQFTSSITNGGATPAYQWKKNGVNITGATLSSYTTDVLVNGDVITLSLTSNAACASTTTATSNAVTMVINAAVTPSVSIAANNTTVCSGTAVNFTATPTNGGTTPTYQWKKNGVNITGATSATYSLTAPANNDVITVVMTSNNACQSTNTSTSNAVTITVTTSLTPSVSIAADATTVCSGTAVNFTATPTNGGTAPTYQWKKNGVNITGATSATYSLTAPANNDVITVVMTSNNACQSTNTSTSNAVTLVVNNAVTPTVSITAGANNVCSGTSIQFTSSITNGGTTPAYQWKKNGVNISGATTASYTSNALSNGDVITLSLTSNAACASTTTAASNALTMVINAAVTPSVNIAANNTTVCSGTAVNFTATPTNGGTTPTYQWKKNGVNITGATSATYSLTAPANNDVITVVMTSNATCASTTTATSNAVTLTVNPNVTYYADADNDGYGNIQSSQASCVVIAGYVLSNTDCNDGNALINPGSIEVCSNGLDDNCSGAIDEGCAVLGCMDQSACNFNPQANTNDQSCIYPELYYNCSGNCLADQDGDGVCDQLEVLGCTDPSACNYNDLATDNDGSCIAPQTEICNQLDDDCDGQVDNGIQYSNYYLDNDGDGFGDVFVQNTCLPVTNANWVLNSGDCQDNNPNVYPTQLESCNSADDNCNGVIDEGVSPGSVQAVSVVTNAYPTCSGNGLKSADFAVGSDSPITQGTAIDLWYSFSAQHTSFRAGLSAAYGDNAIELYVQQGNCMVMIDSEHEVTSGNQILYNDQLNIGTTYYVACRHFAGANNPSAKICFNHFVGSDCDHYYSNNTGVYTSVCSAFKAAYRANAAQYMFGVQSATQNGQPLNMAPWTYTTPTSNSVVSRLGAILPVNNSGSSIVYSMKVGVVYALTDAAGNSETVMAPGTTACQTTLNSEGTIALRSADRCPAYKAIANSISIDRTICGAMRYQWEFTQVLPTPGTPVTVLGGMYSAVLFLNNVPGIANGRTYNVRVRAQHSSGIYGEWGSVQCLRTSATGMALLEDEGLTQAAHDLSADQFMIYPNPSVDGQFTLMWNTAEERALNVKIWDLSGKLIDAYQGLMTGQVWEGNGMNLANGIYFVDVNGKRQRWVVAK